MMKQENKKERKQEMKNTTKKTTFATLKALARKGLLFHNVRGETTAYGMEYNTDDTFIATPTTVEHLDTFKMTTNWIVTENLVDKNADAQLSNCCYYVNFYYGTK